MRTINDLTEKEIEACKLQAEILTEIQSRNKAKSNRLERYENNFNYLVASSNLEQLCLSYERYIEEGEYYKEKKILCYLNLKFK